MWGNAVSPEGKEVAIPHDTESLQDPMKSSLEQADLALCIEEISQYLLCHSITNLLSLANAQVTKQSSSQAGRAQKVGR